MLVRFLFAFFCSIIFAFILTFFFFFRGPGPYHGILFFFAIIFLFTAAVGLLLTPIGPMMKNVPWLSIAAFGLLITLLIAEMLPHHEKAVTIKRKQAEEEDEEVLEKEFGIILVLILLILAAAIVYALTSKPDTFKMTF